MRSTFSSAIRGTDGEVDVGYLAMAWTMASTVAIVPFVAASGIILAWANPEHAGEILQQTGIGIGAICTGCATVIGAVGMFRLGDKDRPAAMVNAQVAQVQQ